MTRRPLFLATLLLTAAGCNSEPTGPPVVTGTFRPVDDGASDRSFAAFREQLQGVIARRDTMALVSMVGQGAKLSFGDDAGGPDGLRTMWFSGAPPDGESVWDVLGRILGAGSVMQDDAISVPYTYGAWPDSVDAFSHVAVVGDSIEARATASDTSRVVALVSYAILPVAGPPSGGFQQVRLPSGTSAFVSTTAAMSPAGYRATFWKDGNVWKLQTLLSGD